MINLGLDFGSTNTLVSVYRDRTNIPEVIHVMTGNYKIPSYVARSKSNGSYFYGAVAVGRLGMADYSVYRAFKMLLQETDPAILKEREFDENHSPEVIAEKFLKKVISDALATEHETEIGVLTIGIPEIWRNLSEESKKNPNAIIRQICERVCDAKEIRIVTEPEAAAAYYAFNYVVAEKRAFQGHVLVVDYGGGTLDITLSKVRPGKSDAESEKSPKYDMQIETVDRTGAGNVHYITNDQMQDYNIGNAGIAFMEACVDAAVRKCGLDPHELKKKNFGRYSSMVRFFEDDLILRASDVSSYYEKIPRLFNRRAIRDMEEDIFTSLSFGDEMIDVSYATIVEAYQDTIYETFEREVNYILALMKDLKIDYRRGNSDNFQLALVGGFGNFYLVEQQLKSLLGINAFGNFIVGDNDREKAIANGAALYADNIVGHQFTSAYTFGISNANLATNRMEDRYIFKTRQPVEVGKDYPVGDEDTFYRKTKGDFQDSFFKLEKNNRKVYLHMKDEYYNELKEAIGKAAQYYTMTFVMDSTDCLSVRIYNYDRRKGCDPKPIIEKKFSVLNEMFVVRN